MVISHNMTAENASHAFKTVTGNKAKSVEKLSSGYRINRAADDAAGMTISEKMRWQIKGLDKGTANSKDGISYLQTADGALGEVHDMLHRMKELAIQASNDTNTDADRDALQMEMQQVRDEIDRIGYTTEFNTRPVFKGRDVTVYGNGDAPVISGDIPASSFSVADMNLGTHPFDQGSDARTLDLSAVVNNNTPEAAGLDYRLIFGGGNTSHSYVRLISPDGDKLDYDIQSFHVDDTSYFYDATTNTWNRSMSYNGITLIQSISGVNESDTKKYYNMTYRIVNDDTNPQLSNGYRALFMFNADTAYGGNHEGDLEESYFISGHRVDKNKVYSKTDSVLTPESQYNGHGVDYSGIPNSISIINTEKALSFSEKIELGDTSNVINLSIGHWGDMNRMNFWDNPDQLRSNANTSTENEDLGFSITWDLGELSANDSKTVSFKYGIVATEADQNLSGVSLTPDRAAATRHESEDELWIQSGATEGNGIRIHVGEMNANVLGLSNVNVQSYQSAQNAMGSIDSALDYVSSLRSNIGAQQNRLEHIVEVDQNTSENTQSAESRIRDTDMSSEMVTNARNNILSQAGISMMAQANSSKSGVLKLLT